MGQVFLGDYTAIIRPETSKEQTPFEVAYLLELKHFSSLSTLIPTFKLLSVSVW